MTETAWLIEQYSPARGPVWFSAIGPEWRFVSDANEALRFARKKDAETFIKWLGGNPLLSNPRATEHAWMAADGALGRQDEVVQPIRDEPISSSKGEALPVVSGDDVWFIDHWTRVLEGRDGHDMSGANINTVRRLLALAALSLPRDASDKGEDADVWARIGADDRLKRARQRLSLHELRMIVDHARARPVPGVSREEVARKAAAWFGLRNFEAMAQDRADLRMKIRSEDGFDINEATQDDCLEFADKMLALLSRGATSGSLRNILMFI